MLSDVTWRCMDVTDLSALASGSFDLALEKFTLDALLCEAKDDATNERGCAAVRELHRVLRPGAALLSIAWGEKRRLELLRGGGLFEVEARRLPGDAPQRPLVYLCRKLMPHDAGGGSGGRTSSSVPSVASPPPASTPDGARAAMPAPAVVAPIAVSSATTAAASPAEPAAAAALGGQGPGDDADCGRATVSQQGEVVEVRIDLCRVAASAVAAGGTGLRPIDVELDLGADRLRWRLRPSGAEGEKETEALAQRRWSEVRLPGPVDTAAAQAKWMRARGLKGPELLLTATRTLPDEQWKS